MQTPPILDPAQFLVCPRTAVLDTFKMTDDSGAFLADINEPYLDKFIAHMNERERTTGDLCPLTIGHTSDDPTPETDSPPIVGYARNYVKGDWTNSKGEQTKAAFADFWIYKKDAELVRKHGMRRSCEVWVSRYEADPISLLGATTPCRDLGLLKLSRDGSVKLSAYQQGELTMPDEKKPDGLPTPDPKESGEAKGKAGKEDQMLALLSQILAAVQGGAGAAPPGAAPAPGAEPELSDEEYEKLLSQLEPEEGGAAPVPDEKGKEGEKPVKEGSTCATPPADDEEKKKMERENAELRTRLSRLEIERELDKIGRTHDVEVTEDLIADLAAIPVDMRGRWLERQKKLSRPKVGGPVGQPDLLGMAVDSTKGNTGKGKRLTDLPPQQAMAEQQRLIKLARTTHKTYEQVAKAEGYTIPGENS